MLNVLTSGAGEPALLLTSGMAGAAYDWLPVVEPLARHRLVLRVERSGLGAAPPRFGLPDLRGEAEKLAGVAATCPGGVVLVAHSVAGLHAEAMSRLYPTLVRGLVLLDPSCGRVRRVGPRWWRSVAERFGRALANGADLLGLTGLLGPALWSAAARGQTSPPVPAPVRLQGRAAFRSATALTAAWQEHLAYQGMINDLATLRTCAPFPSIPARILTATGGMSAPMARRWRQCHRRHAAALLAGHEVLPEARHHLVWDRPDRVLRAITTVAGCPG